MYVWEEIGTVNGLMSDHAIDAEDSVNRCNGVAKTDTFISSGYSHDQSNESSLFLVVAGLMVIFLRRFKFALSTGTQTTLA